jgi:hypothetical protein
MLYGSSYFGEILFSCLCVYDVDDIIAEEKGLLLSKYCPRYHPEIGCKPSVPLPRHPRAPKHWLAKVMFDLITAVMSHILYLYELN